MARREPTGQAADQNIRAKVAAHCMSELGNPDAVFLEHVIAAVHAETARNRFPAASILASPLAEYPAALAAVGAMATDARAHISRRAMRCLNRDTPATFTAKILRTGMADTDDLVRIKTESTAAFLGLTDVIDAMNLPGSTTNCDGSQALN